MSAMRAKTEKQGSKTASRVSSAVKPNLRALNDQNYNNGDNTGTFVFNTAAKERSKIVALSKSLYEAEELLGDHREVTHMETEIGKRVPGLRERGTRARSSAEENVKGLGQVKRTIRYRRRKDREGLAQSRTQRREQYRVDSTHATGVG